MFRVECFVDDKNLATAMRSLAGIAKDLKVVPVANPPGKDGAVKNGELVNLFTSYLAKRGIGEAVAADARHFLKSIGQSPSSAGYLLKKAQSYGVLKKKGAGSMTSYVVQKGVSK